MEFQHSRIFSNESGQGLTEYALIIALIAIAVVAAVTTFGGSLSDFFGQITTTIAAI
ncbi:Flp family type IVb pilin [bacterium]|nr:Flp family type IVb pilin [bacterium]